MTDEDQDLTPAGDFGASSREPVAAEADCERGAAEAAAAEQAVTETPAAEGADASADAAEAAGSSDGDDRGAGGEATPDGPAPEGDDGEESMASFVEAMTTGGGPADAGLVNLRPGDLVSGHVVQVGPDTVLVDVGYKSEGVIPLHEYTYRHVEDATQVAQVGDPVEAMVLSIDREDGTLRLSRRRAEEVRAWGRLKRAADEGEVLEVPVVEAVKGGLVADVGTRGFIPASQVERGFTSDLAKYVGQTVRVKIIELDRAKHRVILSRRVVLEEERRRLRDLTWEELQEGDVRPGTVKSLTPFGAFIDLGGVDGLLHVSEISWGRVSHPSEVLHEGREVQVKVLHLDRTRGRISLSMRQVQQNPWDTVEERYPVGSEHDGRVVRLSNFGAFVELEPGIDGLVHVSELGDHHVARPSDAVQVGDAVRVRVLRVAPVEHRVSLTLRGVPQPQRDDAAEDRPPPSDAEGGMTIGDVWAGRLPESEADAEGDEPTV
jgi:4-hydroxy-3-methylbut-2-enyl diphosphate reductase